MNAKLKQWLDDNTIIDSDKGNAYWYYNVNGQITIGNDGDLPSVSICDKNYNPIYSDCLSYGYHGWATGDDNAATADSLYSLLPQDLAAAVHAEYDGYSHDILAQDMHEYLRLRNGWDFDYAYYESSQGRGEGNMTNEDLVKALDLPYDESADEEEA